MPEPRKKETKNKFISRCISHIYRYEPETLTTKVKKKKTRQAYAICNSIFNRNKKKKMKKNESLICNFETFVNESYKEKRIIDMSMEELKSEHENYIKLQNRGILTPHDEYRWKKISKRLFN